MLSGRALPRIGGRRIIAVCGRLPSLHVRRALGFVSTPERVPEVPQALAEEAAEFRKFARPENEQCQDENDDELGDSQAEHVPIRAAAATCVKRNPPLASGPVLLLRLSESGWRSPA